MIALLALLVLQDVEELHNGIRLPTPRPGPSDPPHYVKSPPAVIPIDMGRQLFVDDFLIAETDLKRTHHRAAWHPKSPVLKPDRPWEEAKEGGVAMAFSDGVWWDPADKLFKMWYMAGQARHTCYATSKDGLAWEKPALDVKAGTNIVQSGPRDSSTVWLDHEAKDPKRRFWMFRSCSGGSTVKGAYGLATFHSPDGIHWSDPPLLTGSCGDRSTVWRDPFRGVWVYSLRHGWGQPRARRYWEMKDPTSGPAWSALGEAPMWTGADALDAPREDYKVPCQLYNLDGAPYESLTLGLFTIWRGQMPDRQKPNEVCVGYSRDGWSWSRPERRAFLAVSETYGDWNYSNVQSVGGGCLVVGDELRFYVSARSGAPKGSAAQGTCVTGLATLRRDGFVSLDGPGSIVTRPVRFSGKRLFVNLNGALKVEVVGTPSVSKTLETDAAKAAVDLDLSPYAGKPVQLRFTLTKGSLYSFWVSADERGASRGYVAAGGPRYSGARDD